MPQNAGDAGKCMSMMHMHCAGTCGDCRQALDRVGAKYFIALCDLLDCRRLLVGQADCH